MGEHICSNLQKSSMLLLFKNLELCIVKLLKHLRFTILIMYIKKRNFYYETSYVVKCQLQ